MDRLFSNKKISKAKEDVKGYFCTACTSNCTSCISTCTGACGFNCGTACGYSCTYSCTCCDII